MKIGDYWRKKSNKTNMNYEKDYGGLDYTDAVVLDVGCAFHTPDFFLDKGAKQVIGIDYFRGRMKEIFEYAKEHESVIPIEMKVTCSKQLEKLYLKYQPTIVKYDCDGCEVVILDMSRDIFRIPEYYVMETHEPHLRSVGLYKNPIPISHVHEAFLDKFAECDYEILATFRGPPIFVKRTKEWKESFSNIKAKRR